MARARPPRTARAFASPAPTFSPHSGDESFAADEVTVCWLATEAASAADQARWAATLAPDEQARAARFHVEADRRDFIAAHALLRNLLTRRFGLAPQAWRFRAEAGGKPRLETDVRAPAVEFNLSHSRGLVAAAAARRGSIGVDVEEVDPAKADFAVAEAHFAASEVAAMRRTPTAERTLLFFRLWTLKEAYIKAIGAGLAAPLDSFAFTLEPVRIELAPGAPGASLAWRFANLQPTDRHMLSVASGRAADEPARLSLLPLTPGDV